MYEYNLGLRFQNVVARHRQRTALWFSEPESVSYEQLNKLANRIARMLLARGIGAGDVVCLSGEKSLQTFASMIACLKIGSVYTTLDPDSPVERARKIVATCRPRLLLAGHDFLEKLDSVVADLKVETVERESAELSTALESFDDIDLPQTRDVTGTNPAYIMFTSGSTGFPKGAVMTHGNVLNLVEWSTETFGITADDVLTNVNPLYFDNSVFDFYSALFTGARLVPLTKNEVRDPRQLVDKIDAAQCSLWFSVPSLLIFLQTMKAANGNHLRSIRRFVFGGEGYPKAKLKGLFDSYSDSSEFFNVYGPTECTCICSCYRITASDFEDFQELPPLGQIAANFAFLIIDEQGQRVRDGEIGELCLLGPNVGRGYYNDLERTAASFVQNPHNDKFEDIMYKTGDLVKFEAGDGKLYIQGRKDNQIKHMGYRVELEEVESALYCLDYLSEAAVIHESANGLSRLVAIVSPRGELDVDQIRRDLKLIIPDYMIPTVFHREEILPKNANGKVDRQYLKQKYLSSERLKRDSHA